jgi:hypothetical protein
MTHLFFPILTGLSLRAEGGAAVLSSSQALAAPLAHIRAAERRLERSIQRVQSGRPLWGSSAVRLGEEAALHRQQDALADFKRSFDAGDGCSLLPRTALTFAGVMCTAAHAAIVKQNNEERVRILKDTKSRLEDLVSRQFLQQLAECERLATDDVSPAMAKVATECAQQLDGWMAKLRARYDDERGKSEAALRNAFAVEAEKILTELASMFEAQNQDRVSQLAAELQAQKNAALSQAASEVGAVLRFPQDTAVITVGCSALKGSGRPDRDHEETSGGGFAAVVAEIEIGYGARAGCSGISCHCFTASGARAHVGPSQGST